VYGGARVHEVLLLWLCEEVFGRCRNRKTHARESVAWVLGDRSAL